MRADRLLSLLMLLQSRGRMTANQLAKELEVSERTIYRDIDALSTSGVPVYGETGPDGGYDLLESYRTNLTGLKNGEVRALFMLSIPSSLDALGVSQDLKQALRKISAALPGSFRGDEEQVRQRFYLDSSWWHQSDGSLPHLRTIQQAVWEDRRLVITHRTMFGVYLDRMVEPYALVAKAGIWYLVCSRKSTFRVYRVSNVIDARISTEYFQRKSDFHLETYWKEWCSDVEESQTAYNVTIRVSRDFIPYLSHYFGNSIREKVERANLPDDQGRIILTVSFETLEAARDRLLDFGRAVEVLEPIALRYSIVDIARQITNLYESQVK
ncbi:MAG: YafY family transcriptional regulator [Chloroflexi bacterium]|nr:MAG: YafY family transcriptional regulator [Chloroflexota bacterium]